METQRQTFDSEMFKVKAENLSQLIHTFQYVNNPSSSPFLSHCHCTQFTSYPTVLYPKNMHPLYLNLRGVPPSTTLLNHKHAILELPCTWDYHPFFGILAVAEARTSPPHFHTPISPNTNKTTILPFLSILSIPSYPPSPQNGRPPRCGRACEDAAQRDLPRGQRQRAAACVRARAWHGARPGCDASGVYGEARGHARGVPRKAWVAGTSTVMP